MLWLVALVFGAFLKQPHEGSILGSKFYRLLSDCLKYDICFIVFHPIGIFEKE